MPKTVIVGLSGGVDSSLVACLLKEEGYHVIGVSMSIYDKDIPALKAAENACYGSEEKKDIKNIHLFGEKIGIETYVFDCSEDYKRLVLSYFKEAYLQGITPNPCVKCNAVMKFGLLQQKALEAGIRFDYFATGHYARIEEENGRYLLKKGIDIKKDQTYFLYRLTQDQLAHTLFPLGDLTKEEVRTLAKNRNLDTYDKPDSQDFYAGDYNDLLQIPPKKGKIMHVNGTILGYHQGYWNYTIGQRKGLGISYTEPLFVLELDAHHNIVWVGSVTDAQKQDALVSDLNWIAIPKLTETLSVQAKQRSTAIPQQALIIPEGDKIHVRFEKPQKSITPGQSMVFYNNDTVLGGGIIEKDTH